MVAKEELITCPFDESHRILKHKMQFHLVRCMKNHKLGKRLRCPWNPLHIIDKFGYEAHCRYECEDLPGVADSICGTEGDVASVPVNAADALLPPAEENWDDQPNGDVGTYDPTKYAEERAILRQAIGLSKAQKKTWRKAERRRFREIEANGPIETAPQDPNSAPQHKSLRQPRNVGRALMTEIPSVDDTKPPGTTENNKEQPEENATSEALKRSHEPSSSLPAESQSSKVDEGACSKSTVASSKSSSSGDDLDVDEVKGFCQSLSFLDTAPKASGSRGPGSQCSINTARSSRGKPDIGGFSFPWVHDNLLDEAAGPPRLVGPNNELVDDDVEELSQRFVDLMAQQRMIEEEKAILIDKLAQSHRIPNLISSNVSLASLAISEKNREDENVLLGLRENKFHASIPKCAANFSKPLLNVHQNSMGIGRGRTIRRDSFENVQVGQRKEISGEDAEKPANKENVSPDKEEE